MEAKAEMLRSQLRDIQERMKRLSDAGPEIVRLERTKELEETNYKYFQGTLEKARVDEALDPSKMPNISAIQRPSPPGNCYKDSRQDRARICRRWTRFGTRSRFALRAGVEP